MTENNPIDENYDIPFEYTTAIKRGSAGNGRAKNTVNHLFVEEAFNDGRLSRDAGTYLCDPDGTTAFPADEGKHDKPREVTCTQCQNLMERWGTQDGETWCMTCGENPKSTHETDAQFKKNHTTESCPAGEPVVVTRDW